MAIEFEGKTIETTETGYLAEPTDWTEGLAQFMADEEGLVLTERHWDLIRYLRSEYMDNGGNQPNTRNLVKAMAAQRGDKSTNAKTLSGRPGGRPPSQRL